MRGQRYRDGSPWVDEVGYSRAVRVGDRVLVSGTAPVDEDGELVAPGDPYRQARRCMEIIQQAIEELGGQASDVVRTRMYVTDVEHWQEIGRAHREVFGEAKPATSMVEVEGLIEEGMVVEVEAEAVLTA